MNSYECQRESCFLLTVTVEGFEFHWTRFEERRVPVMSHLPLLTTNGQTVENYITK